MRAPRAVAIVLLTAFVCAFGVPWLGDAHQFNDDPHWSVRIGNDAAGTPVVEPHRSGDGDHCEVCHLLRIMRTASRPSQARLTTDVSQMAAPVATDPATRAALRRGLSARAPPSPFV